jgi:hypothetical protein
MALNLVCQRCNKRTVRIGVSLFLDIPPKFYAELSKKNVISRETKFMGAGWDRAYFYCTRPSCGWNMHLQEIDILRREVAELKKELEQAKVQP